MAATLIDQARRMHEDVERLERLIAKERRKAVKTRKERLHQDHRVNNMLHAVMAAGAKLVDIYEDSDGATTDEVAALGGQTASGQSNVFSEFYDRLRDIKEYHRHYPFAQVSNNDDHWEAMADEEPYIQFSGEEGYGRFLDLQELFQRFINSRFGRVLEYSVFIDEFCQPHRIPQTHKISILYIDYLRELLHYLVSFVERTQPLQDLEKLFSELVTDFEVLWAAGKVEGWENINSINLDDYHSSEQLAQIGGEKLKEALRALGLKSGGTIQQRAERLWLTKFQPLDQLESRHLVNLKKSEDDDSVATVKDIALLEFKIRRFCELLLQEVIRETKGRLEQKQALTYEEMEEEREEEEIEAESESDEEDEQPFVNPLKLPLGWDNKPIPYWLYKLHGLGQGFKCEICGNCSYRGRRAFERHFKEWKHQHGMRCLGIPNTRAFHEITSIQGAKDLWEKIQKREGLNQWQPDVEEEYEDREGNVYNKRTYTDLQRQGLI